MKSLGKTIDGKWSMWKRSDGKIDLFRRQGLELVRKCTDFTTEVEVNNWLLSQEKEPKNK